MTVYFIVTTLIMIVCILLILVVLVQNSKGGGLVSSFSSSNQAMGVRRTTDFLEKTTWTLAVALVVLSLFSILVKPVHRGTIEDQSKFKQMIDSQSLPVGNYQAPPEEAGRVPSPEVE